MSNVIYHLAHASVLLSLLEQSIETPDMVIPHGYEILCGALSRAANHELQEALSLLSEMQEAA
jgi:hypothetical protein